MSDTYESQPSTSAKMSVTSPDDIDQARLDRVDALIAAAPREQQVQTFRAERGKRVTVNLVETSDNPSGLQLVDANRTTKCGDGSDLVELAKQIQKAEEFVRARAHGRLEVIAEQMKFLQAQAKRVLEEARLDDLLHHAACNMKKVPGTIYYLYERQSGQKYMSLIAPQEWGSTCPHTYLGAYRLEADMSWTPEKKFAQRTRDINFLDDVLAHNSRLLPSLEYALEQTHTAKDFPSITGGDLTFE